MKKKGKTKKIITICITVIMMLCVFIVPSNAATYQPAYEYNITEYTEQTFSSTNKENVIDKIISNTESVLLELYDIESIKSGDIFECEEEKSLLKWKRSSTTYATTKIEVIIYNEQSKVFNFINENDKLYIRKQTDESTETTEYQMQVVTSAGWNDYTSGTIIIPQQENIEIIKPPATFLEEATKGMKTVLEWVTMPFNALINGGWNSLLVLFAIGIAISGVLITIKIIKKFIWGD